MRITHTSLSGAKDLYPRIRLYWPSLCAAVGCIKIPRPREVTSPTGNPGSSTKEGGGETGKTWQMGPEMLAEQGENLRLRETFWRRSAR